MPEGGLERRSLLSLLPRLYRRLLRIEWPKILPLVSVAVPEATREVSGREPWASRFLSVGDQKEW